MSDNTTEQRPAINPAPDNIADQAKYHYAAGTQMLAAMQYRLAELAGTGKLDPDESKDLQHRLVSIWGHLYSGTTSAVRDWATDDSTWDWADNTYSDGTEVMSPGPGDNRTEAQAAAQGAWRYHEFGIGDGAVQDLPYGNTSVIAKPPAAACYKVDNTFGATHDTFDHHTAPRINGETCGPLATKAADTIRTEMAPFTVREICDELGVLLTEEQQFLLEFIGGLVKRDGVVVVIPTEEEIVEDGVMLSVDLHFDGRCPRRVGAATRCYE